MTESLFQKPLVHMWCSPLSHRIVLTPQVSNLCNTGEKSSHYWDIVSSSRSCPLRLHLGCWLLQSPSRRSPLSPIYSLLPRYLLLTSWAFQASTVPRNHRAQQALVALSALRLARLAWSPSTRILSCNEPCATPLLTSRGHHMFSVKKKKQVFILNAVHANFLCCKCNFLSIWIIFNFTCYQEHAERRHFCKTIGNTPLCPMCPLYVSLTYSEDQRRADVDLGSGALGFGLELFGVNPNRGPA